MQPVANTIKALFANENKQVLRISGTDKNGTAIAITDADVLENGFVIDRYCCNGEKLEVGTAIAAQMTLRLNNADGRFDNVVFEGTELFVEIGIADWTQSDPEITYIPCGYFTPDSQPRMQKQINLTCLDRMTKLDVAVDETALVFPMIVASLIYRVCQSCNVTFNTEIYSLPNSDLAISKLPQTSGNITYRNIIQWCAGIMGANAWIDWTGVLRFSWYGTTEAFSTTTANRFVSDLYEDDLSITGVVYTNTSGVEIVFGTDDYAIDLTGNSLAGPYISTVLPNINAVVNGFTYRPLSATVINAPYLWPMDAIVYVDQDGVNHVSVLTNVTFGINGATHIESKGMTYAVNARKKPVGVTKEQAQLINEVAESVEALDDSLTQEEIFNRLTDNGAAQGIILQNGQLYINASYIRSGTLVLGGLNNINGTLQVLDASGALVGTITKDGILVGTSTSSATLNNGIMKFVQNGAEVGRIWPGNTSAIGDYMFINGPESSASSTSDRSALNFWSNGNVDLKSGDETVQLNFDRDTGDASLVADGTVNLHSGGDASLYLTDDGDVEIRSDNGAAYLKLNADGTIYVNNAANWRSAIGANITGVKGNAESTYRTGNVNLTPANIGAVSKVGDTMTGGLTLPSIEMKPSSGGGFIDFHFNGSTADNTVRLMETSEGVLGIKKPSDTRYYPIALGCKLEATYDGSTYGSNIPYVPISGRMPQSQSLWLARNTTGGGNYIARCTTVSGNPAFALEYTLTGSAPQSGDTIIIMYFVI